MILLSLGRSFRLILLLCAGLLLLKPTTYSVSSSPLLNSTQTPGMAPVAAGIVPAYDLVGSDGGIFSFGDAGFYGSMGATKLNAPVVGIASTADGKGYWEVASDGGIFSFGDAGFYGSMGATKLNAPVVGIASDPLTGGYWLVGSDGGIFSFNAPFYGSMGSTKLNAPVVGIDMAPAIDPYSPGQNGVDESWPQCAQIGTSQSDFATFGPNTGVAVVGTTFESSLNLEGQPASGQTYQNTFATNSCLASLYQQAVASGAHPSLYAVLWSAPPASTADPNLFSGPDSACATNGSIYCQAFDWGYNLANGAITYASSQSVTSNLWWLDVEGPYGSSANLWSSNTAVNAQVIAGAIAQIDQRGYQAGIYSDSYQYGEIAGSYAPGLPIWIVDPYGSSATCSDASQMFAGGIPWLVQIGYVTMTDLSGNVDNLDSDLAC